MSSKKPKYGVLDYFLGPEAATQVALSLEEAIEKNKPAALLTSQDPIPAHLLAEARSREIAILGPDSFGVAAPHEGVNYCLSLSPILPGRIAFVTQSGALGASILDWAHAHNVGFSKFISLGWNPTVTIGECIDYLSEDPHTHSILLYLERVEDAGHFLSAARECALRKPIIVLRPGRDPVYDSAFRRCGLLKVNRMADLFYMAEVLERQPRPQGGHLSIITNANGPALAAADALKTAGGTLHELVDLGSYAGPDDYRAAFERMSADPACHGILIVVTPQPATRIADTARSLAALAHGCRKTVLASFMGGKLMGAGAAILAEAGVPILPYADTAAKVFHRLWLYSRSLSGLYETPMFEAELADTASLRATLEARRGPLDAATTQLLLRAYEIPLSQASSPTNLSFTIQSRVDATFGPVLFIGASGLGTSVYEDQIASLPPLTSTLARRALELIRLTRICTAEAMAALEETLVRISRMVSDLAILREIDIELRVEPDGTIWAGGASVLLQPADLAPDQWPRCVIRPYPSQYVAPFELKNGEMATLRPIRPEDEGRIVDFHNDLSERSVYLRYLQFLKFEERIDHARLARVCFNDYSRELALVVEKDDKILGVARLQRNPLRMEEAEVAFLVRDSAQGKGIGKALVFRLIEVARLEGLTRLTAELLADNKPMRSLLEKAGFRMRLAMDGQTLLASMAL